MPVMVGLWETKFDIGLMRTPSEALGSWPERRDLNASNVDLEMEIQELMVAEEARGRMNLLAELTIDKGLVYYFPIGWQMDLRS